MEEPQPADAAAEIALWEAAYQQLRQRAAAPGLDLPATQALLAEALAQQQALLGARQHPRPHQLPPPGPAARPPAAPMPPAAETPFHLLAAASLNPVYKMSADWRRMHQLAGQGWLADTPATTEAWLQAYIPAADWPTVSAAIEHAIQTKSVFELEHPVFLADGSVGWVHSRAVPVLDAGGELVEWLGTGSDITARKRAEQGLQASRELLQATIDSSLDLVQVFEAVRDEQGTIVDFTWVLNNQAAEQRYGNVIGQRLLARNPGVVDTGIFAAFKHVVETGQPDHHERHYTREQFNGWFSQSIVKLRDGVATTTVDITARKQAEQELLGLRDEVARQVQDRYRALFNSIDEGFCLFELCYDAQGAAVDYRFVEVNHVFEQQTGLIDAPGQLGSVLTPGTEPSWLAAYDQVVQTGQPLRFENYHRGTGRWYEAYASRVGDDGSRLLCTAFRDVTERKAHEQQQAFRVQLIDALRPLTDAVAIQETTAQLLGGFLAADRCYYGEIADGCCLIRRDAAADGLPSMAGTYPLAAMSPFEALLNAGRPLVVEDGHATDAVDESLRALCAQLQVIAYVHVPVIKNGQAVGTLYVGQRTARRWTPAEVVLVEEVADRTWAAVERARAQQARYLSEARLRTLVENLPGAAVFVVGPDLRYELAEGDALHLAGFQPADLLGRTLRDALPAALWPAHEAHYRQALAGQPFAHEHEAHGRAFVTRGAPLRDAAGQVLAALAVSYDITERLQAEAALSESEERFRNLVESYAQAVWETDLAGQVVQDSPSWRTYTGQTEAEWRGNGWVGAIYPDDQAYADRQWREAVATGRAVNSEFRLKWALGGYRWTNVRATPIRDAWGRTRKWVGMNIDIHDRKTAEDALRQTEVRLRLALDAAELGTWDWNLATDEVSLNARHFTLFGLEPRPEPVTPAEFARYLHPDDRPGVLERLQAAIAGNDLFQAEFRVNTAQGELRWMHGHGQPTAVGSDGRVLRLSGVVLDITQRKHTEQYLQNLAAALERRVQRRTQALHDSRDLLQSVYDTTLIGMALLHVVRDEASGAIKDFTFRSANKELTRLTGRPDLVERRLTQEFPGMAPSGVLALMAETAESGLPQQAELFYPYDGLHCWLAVMFVKLDGGVVATILDITQRKTAEQQLVRNLHLLEQAETVAQLGSWEYDLASGQLYWSTGMYHLFGLPPGQPVTPSVYLDYVVDEDRSRAEQLVQHITTGADDFETPLRVQVGGIKMMRIKAVVLHNEQGQAVRVLGVALNLSELHRLEADNLRLHLGQQQALFEAVQAAEEAERRRMAESLHNGIGQLLYATKLQLDCLPATPALPPRQQADHLLSEAIRQTRALSHELTPAILEDYGLEKTLQSMCSALNGPGLHWHCHLNFEEGPALPMPLQLAVYRLAQELAQNVLKHAHATYATLEVDVLPAWVVLRVEDNGRGFDPARNGDGLGLRSTRSRAALLGGSVHLTTAPSQGTQCQIRIPLSPPAP